VVGNEKTQGVADRPTAGSRDRTRGRPGSACASRHRSPSDDSLTDSMRKDAARSRPEVWQPQPATAPSAARLASLRGQIPRESDDAARQPDHEIARCDEPGDVGVHRVGLFERKSTRIVGGEKQSGRGLVRAEADVGLVARAIGFSAPGALVSIRARRNGCWRARPWRARGSRPGRPSGSESKARRSGAPCRDRSSPQARPPACGANDRDRRLETRTRRRRREPWPRATSPDGNSIVTTTRGAR
jgi:hypothetical protein